MKRYFVFIDWKNQHTYIIILPKAINRFSSITIKITMAFLKEIGEKIIKFIKNCKRPRISKAILRRKIKVLGNTLSDFKLYSKATIIKTSWYCQKKIHPDQ